MKRRQPRSTRFPYTTVFRSLSGHADRAGEGHDLRQAEDEPVARGDLERLVAPALLEADDGEVVRAGDGVVLGRGGEEPGDRKSTAPNSSPDKKRYTILYMQY